MATAFKTFVFCFGRFSLSSDCHSIGKIPWDIWWLCWLSRWFHSVCQLLVHCQYAFSAGYAGYWQHLSMTLHQMLSIYPMTKDPNAIRFKLNRIFGKSYEKFCILNGWVFVYSLIFDRQRNISFFIGLIQASWWVQLHLWLHYYDGLRYYTFNHF